MKNLSKNTRYFIILVGVGISVMLVFGFNNRAATLRRLKEEDATVDSQLMALEITKASLETKIANTTSVPEVERYAYGARMVREGDKLIVPVYSQESTPTLSSVVVLTPEPAENWQVWKALFFDQ